MNAERSRAFNRRDNRSDGTNQRPRFNRFNADGSPQRRNDGDPRNQQPRRPFVNKNDGTQQKPTRTAKPVQKVEKKNEA